MNSDKVLFYNDFISEEFIIYSKVGDSESDDGEETKGSYKVDDIVNYKTKKWDDNKDEKNQPEGAKAEGMITKVIGDGGKYKIFNKNIDKEFRINSDRILGKSETSPSEEKKDDEKKDDEKKVFKIGDKVEYKRRSYDDTKSKNDQNDAIAQGEIRKVIRDGKKYRIYNKGIDREFTKSGDDILGILKENNQVVKYNDFK